MNNFQQQQQAMMMGQPMQQGIPPQQNLRSKLLAYFQNNQQHAGWQATVQPIERVGLVSELVTSLQLAQPNLPQQEAVKRSMTFEAERLSQSGDKNQYTNEIRKQLSLFRSTREQQAQNTMNMMQMNNQNGLQPGMNGGVSMQQSISNQGNQFPQAFNPQLAHPMQASPIPVNGQNPAMGMMGNANPNAQQAQMLQQQQQQQQQQAQQQQAQQQQQQGQRAPSQADMAQIHMMAQRQMNAAPQEIKNKILQQFSALDPQKQAAVRAKFGDPVAAHFKQAAHQAFNRSRQAQMQNQGGQNVMSNNMMGQQTPQQRPQQMANGQPGTAMQSQDSNLLQQQQDAMNRATNGEPVVPASNNNNMGQFGGLQMGLAQNAPLGAQGMNFQNQQQMQALQNRQANFQLNPQASAQMQARIAQAQAQVRARAAAQQQQNVQGQPGGQPNQQMNGQRPIGTQPRQSPMPMLTQPVIPPGQQPGGTPQQRPQPTPQMPQQNGSDMFQAMQSAQNRVNALGATNPLGGQNQPILRILPGDLPASMPENLKMQLQTMDEEHYKQALERIRTHSQSKPGTMVNGMPARQPGLGQTQMPGQPGPAGLTPLQFQQRQAQAARAQSQMQQQQPNGQQFPVMTPEIMARMDNAPFPKSILAANNITAPDHINSWMQLKTWIQQNASGTNINLKQLMALQVSQFQQNQMRLRQQQQQQQQNATAQMGGQPPNQLGISPAQPAPTAPMVPNGMTPQQQQARMGMNGMMAGMPRPNMPQLSAEDLQTLRIKAGVAPNITDDQLRQRFMQQRMEAQNKQNQARLVQQQVMQRGQQQIGAQAAQGQPGAPQAPAPQMSQVPMRQHQQNQQQNSNPQVNAQMQQNRQMQRPGQVQNGSATPQPPPKNLKRPAPQDEVIDITDTPQAVAMQQTNSQQQRPQFPNNQAAQNRPQPGQPPQKQHQEKRMAEMMAEVQGSTPRPAALQVDQETRQLMINKIQEFKQFINRIDQCIKMFFVMTNDEDHTKRYMKQRILLSYNFNFKDPNLTLVEQPSLKLETLEQYLVSFRTVVASVMQKMKQNATPQGQQLQQTGQNGQAGSPSVNGQKGNQPPQLNANNLKQLQQQQQMNVQQQRRASNKGNVAPPAPISGPGQGPIQFPFSNTALSPQGVPQYGSNPGLTPDKLKIQPSRKKFKQSPVTTPNGTSTSPQIGNKGSSPDLRREALTKPEVPKPPQFRCTDRYCEQQERAFETEEELKEHSRIHAQPVDSLKYANESLATALGFNADGTVRQTAAAEVADGNSQHGPGKPVAAAAKREATTPFASTPMSRAPTLTKGSPALDRLKNPLQKQQAAPTSAVAAAASVEKKDEKSTEMPVVSAPQDMAVGETADPWAEATVRPKELQDLFGSLDNLTGDWGFDRTFDTPDTPATTPDTNVSKETVSTDISENDNLNILLGGVTEAAMGNTGKNGSDDFVAWHEIQDHWQSVMDGDLAQNMGAVGIDEGMILRLDEDTDVNDWEGMFGKGSNLGGNQIPGWEQEDIPMF
ncbi:hypothetical protein FKW77_002656 [Venturia effusa]|uniref:Mediator complex subunit 15 KIX domain-containing protein n=1 Tax=Venturia effusa TaxID=50376 RepID=A0A517LDE7_9PEZI|nr:hypothetical protein FKW77_002656 [Venturia effusa]